MGRCIISLPSGGGSIDNDELTALPENVEVGKMAGVQGHDDATPGTLRNVSNDSNVRYNSSSNMRVIKGSNAYVSQNTDGVTRAQIRFSEQRGVIENNTIIGIPQNDMATAGGLNASKLLANQYAFGIRGTATNDADFDSSDLLVSKSAYKNGTKVNGNMPNNGAAGTSLNCGGSYTIPKGYHNGNGKVTANSLASQTSANSSANTILSGYTAWVNGSKITGNVAVQSILSFSAAPYSSTQITFTWKNPAKGAYSGVIIVGKTGGYPTSINDGTRYYKGCGNNTTANGMSSVVVNNFVVNTQYYFRAFSYAIKNNAEWVHATTYTSAAKTVQGTQVFTSSGIFTVPDGVRSIDIFCVGGGGAGCNLSDNLQNGGGGGGYTATKKGYAVTPGQTYAVTIGGQGGTTSFGNVLSAEGGKTPTALSTGGNGGSGGGAALLSSLTKYSWGNQGGSDGSDGLKGYGGSSGGSSSEMGTPGKGQGTTTRAFGDASGTVYAGGGGGASFGDTANGYAQGGFGGGGAGGYGYRDSGTTYRYGGVAGSANTGGGGGGGYSVYGPGAGGSGICLIRYGY